MHSIVLALVAVFSTVVLFLVAKNKTRQPRGKVPISVNYHFSRKCNKSCGFCFHTATTSHIESIETAKKGLWLLKKAGMRKINFAGGEPFLYPKFLGQLIVFCKKELGLESVSIVTNGSKVTEAFLARYGPYLDILAVSCDSFNEDTNIAIGRGAGDQVAKLYDIAAWCRKYRILFKINTVVNKLNHMEDMNAGIARLQPFRWKCFQVLIVAGENDSDDRAKTLRNGHTFTISDAEFDAFCARHKAQACLVPEPNRLMAKSYLILDEYLRFLDRTGRAPSKPIVEVGVQEALQSVYWDEDAFLERGGIYQWDKNDSGLSCGGKQEDKELEW